MDNQSPAVAWPVTFECVGQSRVKFDDVEFVDVLEQWKRESAKTATDLDDPVVGLRCDCGYELCDYSRVVKEVLAELFLCA